MPYRIHPDDRHGLALKLAELLRQIPDQQLDDVTSDAKAIHNYAEFGHPGLVRNCTPGDPYWFERQLMSEAKRLLADGNPLGAFANCLHESNHGHSGFTDQVRRVYCRPTNARERKISEQIRELILEVAHALIASNPLSFEKGLFSKGWMSMVGIDTCIRLLGADVPVGLIEKYARLLDEYKEADPDNREVESVRWAFQRRFK